MFDSRQEEENLCDVGAGHLLLHPSWLLPLVKGMPPSLDRLLQICETCGASIEATALQLARLGASRCTFVFWELGLKKLKKWHRNSRCSLASRTSVGSQQRNCALARYTLERTRRSCPRTSPSTRVHSSIRLLLAKLERPAMMNSTSGTGQCRPELSQSIHRTTMGRDR